MQSKEIKVKIIEQGLEMKAAKLPQSYLDGKIYILNNGIDA